MENKKPQVFIERASPLTKKGIASMCCSEEEYKWYCRGLEDGREIESKKLEKQSEDLRTKK